MGKMIEKIILSRGLEYAGWSEAVTETDPVLAKECVCIDFTTPAAFRANYRFLAENFSFVKNKVLLSSLLVLSLLFAVFLGYRKEINLHLRPKDAQYFSALKEITGILKKEEMPPMRIRG